MVTDSFTGFGTLNEHAKVKLQTELMKKAVFKELSESQENDGHCPWTPSQEDMMAEDWEIKTKTVSNTKTDRDGLLYLSMLLFFFALEQRKNEC